MGYKLLGMAVYNGGKWYLRRRYADAGRRALIAGGVVLVGAAVIAVATRRNGG
jgi:hypothetical protein